jgi:protein associated with RNAse G/E
MTPYYDHAGIISLIDFDIDIKIVAKQLSQEVM